MTSTSRPSFTTLFSAAVLSAALLATGCHGGAKQDPILQLSAEESLTTGKSWMVKEKYARARKPGRCQCSCF